VAELKAPTLAHDVDTVAEVEHLLR